MEPQKINSLYWKALPTPVKPILLHAVFKAGARVPTKVDPNYETTNLGCVSFNGNNTPYFINKVKIKSFVLGYCKLYEYKRRCISL